MLGSLAALRVGAGWLTIALRASVAGAVAVTIPKCGVVPLQETNDGHIDGGLLQAATTDLQVADALLVGPGPDDADAA
jgi:NAD(P)H-hydrate repair Nnr-like enzyme with NAD(P)H-hydrate dehydratase domain